MNQVKRGRAGYSQVDQTRPEALLGSDSARSSNSLRFLRSLLPARLMQKFSIGMTDWYGVPLRRLLASADRLKECAISGGSLSVKTSASRSKALLRRFTSTDR